MKIGNVVSGDGSPVGNPYDTFPLRSLMASEGHRKWNTTRTHRYATADMATIEAYLSEFSFFRKQSGPITNSMMRVMLKFLLSSREFLVKTKRINGIRSPTTMMYEMPTPKHFMAMARSNMMLRLGLMSCAREKNDALLAGVY